MANEQDVTPRLLSVRDAARMLSIGERAVWALISRGELRAMKIGRRTLIHVADLDSFIASYRDAHAR